MAAIDPLSIQIDPEHGVALRWVAPDGKAVDLLPMLFTWRLAIGRAGWPVYDEFYCFPDRLRALSAFLLLVAEPEREPVGWVRHVPSHRRREDGDPARETVAP